MRGATIAALLGSALAVSACAYYDEYGAAGWDGRSFGSYRYSGGEFSGSGADVLDPWLAGTEEGRRIVGLGFDGRGDGRISDETAHRANVWFRRYADHDGDMRLTDAEIRTALAHAARATGQPY